VNQKRKRIMAEVKQTLEEKLKGIIEEKCAAAEKNGSTSISTCNAFIYGWDADTWNHRHAIMDGIRKRGYNVSSSTNHGVLDISITKKLDL